MINFSEMHWILRTSQLCKIKKTEVIYVKAMKIIATIVNYIVTHIVAIYIV